MTLRRLIILVSTLMMLYVIGIFFVYILIDFIVFNPVRHSQNTVYHFDLPHTEFKLSQPNE